MNSPINWIIVPMNVNYITISASPIKNTPDPCTLPFLVKNFTMPATPMKKYSPRKKRS